MLQYLKASNYNGSLIREFKTLSESQTFLENQQLISGLGILTSLCMLQLHKSPAKAIITPTDKDVWAQVTNLKELNQSSAPLFFAIVQQACLDKDKKELSQSKEVVEFMEAFKQRSAINLIDRLLNELLFSHSSYKD